MYRTIGILAHVDAGKTTLSERLLTEGGSLRAPTGAFLDTDVQERKRGITIFTGQAEFTHGGHVYQLADTPGHVDFAAAIEKAWDMGIRRYVTEFWYKGSENWKEDLQFAHDMMAGLLDAQAGA